VNSSRTSSRTVKQSRWRLSLALGGLLLAPVIALAQGGASVPGGGIAGTVHDFNNGAAVQNAAVGLCTFCHTPHKAQQSRLLWNHTLSANTFSWSDATSTTGGTTLPAITPSYTGPTVKCLSCHDGTVAIGDVSWYKEQPNHGANALDPSKIGAGNLIGSVSDTGVSEFQIATAGGDMKGNHPVAVAFPFGNAPSTYNATTTGASALLSGWQADPQSLNIRLFTDNTGVGSDIVAGATAAKTGIECSSCHDPHNKASVEDLFLRGSLVGNDTTYICQKCHNK